MEVELPDIDALYRQHGQAVLRYARKVSNGDHYAEDAAQEAWIALLGADGVERPERWLAIAAKREFWRYARRQARSTSVGDYDMLDAPCDGGQEQMTERARIADAVANLKVPRGPAGAGMQSASESMRDNLAMMFCGLDSVEIAKARGVSSAGVRASLERGVKALKKHWGIDD